MIKYASVLFINFCAYLKRPNLFDYAHFGIT